MKTVHVAAAVIKSNHKIFATQRGYGEFKGGWEFPGGKIEPGERPEDALKREIREELNTEIEIHNPVGTIEYDYPNFHLTMKCYWCSVVSGTLELLEYEAARWLNKGELYDIPWLPADLELLETIKSELETECFGFAKEELKNGLKTDNGSDTSGR